MSLSLIIVNSVTGAKSGRPVKSVKIAKTIATRVILKSDCDLSVFCIDNEDNTYKFEWSGSAPYGITKH